MVLGLLCMGGREGAEIGWWKVHVKPARCKLAALQSLPMPPLSPQPSWILVAHNHSTALLVPWAEECGRTPILRQKYHLAPQLYGINAQMAGKGSITDMSCIKLKFPCDRNREALWRYSKSNLRL